MRETESEAAVSPLRLGIDELEGRVGEHLGRSSWHLVSQEQINAFADATQDHQWIHVDAERALIGPFKTTIAHGYLTLSLIPVLLHEVVEVEGTSLVVNYGLNRVRFPAPVPSGSRVRLQVELAGTEEVEGAVQARFDVTFEVEGPAKPCCVAEILFRFYR